jgi:outer membrane lipoprotein-sorting protein
MKTFKFFIFSIITFLLATNVLAQEINGSKIIQNMKERAALVKDYTADIEANINMENIRMPRVKIKVFHKYPNKFHYESKNFALLPKQGLNFDPFDYDEKDFNFNLLRTETLNNTQVYVVEIEGKKVETKQKEKGKDKEKAKIIPQKSYVWVDANNWVPKKISSEPNEKRKISVSLEHSWIDGKYYLPSKLFFEYDIPDLPEAPDIPKNPQDKGQKLARGGKGGKGSVSFTFLNYKVNTGLSDDIFIEKGK